ncbi:hypothetical protein DUI87_02535 [Hirundo rustica rustica]|uniref:Integrase catalytic domain-containing protein n=1 Tax=Hirundo rustica rustica TaxID=333673 RepID=A0A3M0LRM4_HIRRU|nr:hypothetical protein DUI87_02535 [Hirundo rustica rustica]
MSKTVSSVLVVNKNGGDVGKDEARKPYKYDCLDSENVKPVIEIELKRKLVRLGPQEYSSALAIMKRDDTEETVLNIAKKLRAYADAVHSPTYAKIAALKTQVRGVADKLLKEKIDYITLPQTHQGKRYVLTMVEATTGWLETYPVSHATAQNIILGLEKQILWRHGTPERIESDNGTHFKNSLINTWAREHGIEWVYHTPYHAPAAGKVERCNGLLKTTLKALGGGTFKNWEINLAKATWLVNTRGSTNQAGPAQSEPLRARDGDKVPVVHMRASQGENGGRELRERDKPHPGPAGHTILDTGQDAIGLFGHQGPLLAHVQSAVDQHPQVPFYLATVQPHHLQPITLQGVIVDKMQDSGLGLTIRQLIGLCPSTQLFQVSLQTPTTFQQIDICSQLSVICKFTNDRLNTLIHIINKNIEQNWPQHRPLRNTTGDWPPAGCSTAHHHSLGPAIQPVPNPAKSAPVQAMGCQLIQEYAVGDSVKGLAEIQIDNIHSLSHIHHVGHLVIKGDQVGQTQTNPLKPVLAGSDTLTIL